MNERSRLAGAQDPGVYWKAARACVAGRGRPSEGRLATFRRPVVSDRLAMSVEPPPSRLMALTAPNERIRAPISASLTPTLYPGCRPSTVTMRTLPSAVTPTLVRGSRRTDPA